MKYLKFVFPLVLVALIFSCKDTKEKETVAEEVTEEVAKADPMADLPDWQYVGYKIAHHM